MVRMLEAHPEPVPAAMKNVGINFSHPRYAVGGGFRPRMIFSLFIRKNGLVFISGR